MQPLDFILNFGGVITAFSQQHSEWILPLLFLLVFCETGLVLTPFLPGNTLLLIAGGLAAVGDFALYEIFGLLAVAALLGDSMGFFFGRLLGPSFVKPAYLAKANAFQTRFGSRAFTFARFLPLVRGLVPFIAGANDVPYRVFLLPNSVGVASCVAVFCSAGYFSTQLRQVPVAAWAALAIAAAALAAALFWRYRRRRQDLAISSDSRTRVEPQNRPDHEQPDKL